MGGRGTDDDDTHERHTDTNKLTRHTASKVTTVASGPAGDGKKDKYPSKNRPAFAFQEIRRH